MKNFTTKIGILGLALILLMAACGGGNSNSGNKAASNNGEKYTLEYKLAKGEVYKQNSLTEMSMDQEIMGQKMKIATTTYVTTNYEIIDVNDGIINMQMKYDEFKMDMDMNMGGMGSQKISFDSNIEDTIATLENMSPMFKAMIGVPINLTVNKKSKLQSLDGFDKLLEATMNSFEEGANTQTKEQMAEVVEQQMNAEIIKTSFEQMSAYFPENPVGVGESWPHKIEIMAGQFKITADMKITLKSVDNNVATFENESTLSSGKENTIQVQGMEAKIKIDGSQKGTVGFDLNTGWLIKSEIKQEIKGEMEMMGMKIPINISTKITIK